MKKKENTLPSKHCANYTTGYICLGVMIGVHLEQWVDSEKEGKLCLLRDGKECDYFDKCVKPIL
jgi:hypothetical protein